MNVFLSLLLPRHLPPSLPSSFPASPRLTLVCRWRSAALPGKMLRPPLSPSSSSSSSSSSSDDEPRPKVSMRASIMARVGGAAVM